MISVKYSIRHLRARWVTSLLTVAGTSLVVWASLLALGLSAGLEHTLEVSSDPLDLIALRRGATAEASSSISEPVASEIANLPGISRDRAGQPACSLELVVIVNTTRRHNTSRTNLIVRGVTATAKDLRPGFRIVEGRDFQPGVREAIASRPVARRFLDASLGDSLDALDEPLRIVGIFEADDCAAESEVWTDLHGLAQISGESGFVSSVQLRAASREDLGALQQRLSTDSQFGLKAMTEGEYFASQFVTGLAIKTVGRIISLFLIIAAMFAIANTMFSAMESRAREIGTLRALGFSRSRIMFAVLFESLVLCLLGSGLGCLGTLPLNGLATGTANWVTFSELTFLFRLGPALLIKGALLACLMGVTGGLLPAIRAIRMNTIVALREY